MSDSAQPNPSDNQNPTEQPANDPAPKDKAPDITQKLMDELKKTKDLAKEYQMKLKQRESEDLKNNQKWQELAELKEKEALEKEEKLQAFTSKVAAREKLNAIKQEAIQAGLRKESIADLRLIDFPELKLESNNEDDFTVTGADKAVQRLKTLRPHWFKVAAPKVNSDSPSVTGDGNKLTTDMVLKLEKEWKKNPTPANAEKYKGALLEFRKQSSVK